MNSFINESDSYYNIEKDCSEEDRKAMLKIIRKASSKMILQLRFAKLEPSTLKSFCGIRSDTMFNSVIMYIEKTTRYSVIMNDKGLLELRIKPKRKTGAKKKKPDIDKLRKSASRSRVIETPERYMQDPSRFKQMREEGNALRVDSSGECDDKHILDHAKRIEYR